MASKNKSQINAVPSNIGLRPNPINALMNSQLAGVNHIHGAFEYMVSKKEQELKEMDDLAKRPQQDRVSPTPVHPPSSLNSRNPLDEVSISGDNPANFSVLAFNYINQVSASMEKVI